MSPAPNPFDPELLRLPQDFGAGLGVKKLLTTLPVRRPDRQWFVRVHPTLRIETAVFELKEERETYLVSPEMRAEIPGELVAKALLLAVTRQNSPFLWPIRLPDESGRLDEWNRSAAEAAKLAETQWVRLVANRSLGAYDTFLATGDLPDPGWPDLDLEALLKLAFRDRYISSLDHPVVQRLLGRS